MKIGELAEITGVSKDTIRYYEKVDLIHPEIINKQRYYNMQDIVILETILKLKHTGFSLKEINMLFKWSQNTEQNKKLSKEELENILQIKELYQKKYEQMIQKEIHIKQIKDVLLKADAKLSKLIEEYNGHIRN